MRPGYCVGQQHAGKNSRKLVTVEYQLMEEVKIKTPGVINESEIIMDGK